MKDQTKRMLKYLFCIVGAFALILVLSCSTARLPYMNKRDAKKEFNEMYYYRASESIGFRKTWNWRFFSKKDAVGIYNRYTGLFSSIISNAEPVYAAKRNSFDQTNEYCLVFKIKEKEQARELLQSDFRRIHSLLYNTDYNFQNLADKSIELYYRHDLQQRRIFSVAYINQYMTNTCYLSIYIGNYNNQDKFLEQFTIWDKRRIEMKEPTYKEAVERYGTDTLLQLQGFVSQNAIIKSIDHYPNIDTLKHSGW
jgi:hypothetical protein